MIGLLFKAMLDILLAALVIAGLKKVEATNGKTVAIYTIAGALIGMAVLEIAIIITVAVGGAYEL